MLIDIPIGVFVYTVAEVGEIVAGVQDAAEVSPVGFGEYFPLYPFSSCECILRL